MWSLFSCPATGYTNHGWAQTLVAQLVEPLQKQGTCKFKSCRGCQACHAWTSWRRCRLTRSVGRPHGDGHNPLPCISPDPSGTGAGHTITGSATRHHRPRHAPPRRIPRGETPCASAQHQDAQTSTAAQANAPNAWQDTTGHADPTATPTPPQDTAPSGQQSSPATQPAWHAARHHPPSQTTTHSNAGN